MLIALNEKGERVIASRSEKGEKFFCQGCGEPLLLKKGSKRLHHFAHKSGTACEYTTNKTEWHYAWQELFGVENSERVFSKKGYKHIADVQIGDTVVEFQHSPISDKDVAERCQFYMLFGLNPMWVFDVRKEVKEKKLYCYEKRKGYNWLYQWNRPKSAVLRALDSDATVYLQADDKYLIKITWYPTGIHERTSYSKKNRFDEGDYWSKLNKFAATIMTKNSVVNEIRNNTDLSYKPRYLADDCEISYLIETAHFSFPKHFR